MGIPILQIIRTSVDDGVAKEGMKRDGNNIVGDAIEAPEVTPPYTCW